MSTNIELLAWMNREYVGLTAALHEELNLGFGFLRLPGVVGAALSKRNL